MPLARPRVIQAPLATTRSQAPLATTRSPWASIRWASIRLDSHGPPLLDVLRVERDDALDVAGVPQVDEVAGQLQVVRLGHGR
jgi:hypothetical protein